MFFFYISILFTLSLLWIFFSLWSALGTLKGVLKFMPGLSGALCLRHMIVGLSAGNLCLVPLGIISGCGRREGMS